MKIENLNKAADLSEMISSVQSDLRIIDEAAGFNVGGVYSGHFCEAIRNAALSQIKVIIKKALLEQEQIVLKQIEDLE